MLDDIPGIGPMGGIITALKKLHAPCLVLACDIPALNRNIIARLIEHREASNKKQFMTTFQQPHTGFIESLVAIYEPECLNLLLASYNQGCYRLSKAVPPEVRLHIPYDVNEESFFFNVNYPGDLEQLNALFNEGTEPDSSGGGEGEARG